MNHPDQAIQAEKPILLVFSPMPPIENGIADYCYELLPELAITYNTYVVVDNHAPTPFAATNWKYMHVAEYQQREGEFSNSIYLYHLGNNPDHDYLVPILLEHPGIVVLHDISLHHLVDQITLRWGNTDAYCDLIEREYGNPGRVLANQFRSHQLRERIMFYELPMIRLIASRSKVVIVHSWFAKTKVLAQEPDVPVEVVGHHIAPSAIEAEKSLDKAEARRLLGVRNDELLLVSQGFITKAKQIDTVLETLARCRQHLPSVRYILAGKDQPEHYDVQSKINSCGLQDIVEITGYLDEDEFYIYSIAADIVINLRYPTGGETSGTLIRALGVGACVMVVDIGPFSEFPDETCVKIPWSATFETDFMSTLVDLAGNPKKRSEIGQTAKLYIQTRNSLASSGDFFRRTIRTYADRNTLAWNPIQKLEYPTPSMRERIMAKVRRASTEQLPLWFREMQFPIASSSTQNPTIIIGNHNIEALLCDHLDYSTQSVKVLKPENALAELKDMSRRTVAHAILSPEHYLASDEWNEVISELNRVLELNAVLLISASQCWPAAGSQLRMAISAILEKSGFRLEKYTPSPQDFSFALDVPSEEMEMTAEALYYPCWLATKISEFVERQ